jgi:hypothetical protein
MSIGAIPDEGPAALTFFVKCLLASRGDTAQAASLAESAGADVIAALLRRPYLSAEHKAAVLAGSTVGWGSPLAQFQAIVTQFEGSLRTFGAFDAMLPLMRRVPLGLARLAIMVTGATGHGVGQGAPKPISSLQLASGDFEPTKATCIIVVTDELTRLETPQGLLADELRAAVAASTDSVFLPGLIDSSTPSIIATGNDRDHFLANLATAAGYTSQSSRSRLVLVLDPLTCANVSLLPGDEFADMTPTGGFIRGIQVVSSDAIERDSSGARLLLIDASQIAAATASITLDASEQATLELNSAPADTPSAAMVLTSMWQQNLRALKATRWFSFKRLRDNAVVAINGANYGVAV